MKWRTIIILFFLGASFVLADTGSRSEFLITLTTAGAGGGGGGGAYYEDRPKNESQVYVINQSLAQQLFEGAFNTRELTIYLNDITEKTWYWMLLVLIGGLTVMRGVANWQTRKKYKGWIKKGIIWALRGITALLLIMILLFLLSLTG